jgi:predicted RNase H-like HicB family nuclease
MTTRARKCTYTLSIERHPEGYLASFPALPGCHTWGKTYEEAVKHAGSALRQYLETLSAHGDALPEDADTRYPVSLSITVRTTAIAKGHSVSTRAA